MARRPTQDWTSTIFLLQSVYVGITRKLLKETIVDSTHYSIATEWGAAAEHQVTAVATGKTKKKEEEEKKKRG